MCPEYCTGSELYIFYPISIQNYIIEISAFILISLELDIAETYPQGRAPRAEFSASQNYAFNSLCTLCGALFLF